MCRWRLSLPGGHCLRAQEEQANLLGELVMLRHHNHPHLVEFIGTAIAMERGVDTVMLAMELCDNGALRETLKLDIAWPLKVCMCTAP